MPRRDFNARRLMKPNGSHTKRSSKRHKKKKCNTTQRKQSKQQAKQSKSNQSKTNIHTKKQSCTDKEMRVKKASTLHAAGSR
mmetsp:Transcript_92358/g.202238  ORF Transcript_92358/g.202238 Transcript_92358/m.202238 type:complete len:82 (+) Transcript_92358:52-297(+)